MAAAGDELGFERLQGEAARAVIDDVARLRIAVFRDYPYLYDGDLDYERRYLKTYLRSPRAAVIVARASGAVVGASTVIPLADETDEIQAPFRAAGLEVESVIYLGESVLLRPHRGRGAGAAFFRMREEHAANLDGFELAAFCAVERCDDDPRRPEGYEPLDSFWRRRGYERRDDMRTTISWREVGEAQESPKPMVFWIRRL